MLKRLILPGTDLVVSNICLGTGDIGSGIDKVSSFKLLDNFFEQGGNFVDTAKVYADWIPNIERSISEKTLGEWCDCSPSGNSSRNCK